MDTGTRITNDAPRQVEDWYDLGLLVILVVIEIIIWGMTGFSSLVLFYGFICAIRGLQLNRMRKEGIWKRLKDRLSQKLSMEYSFPLNQK